MKFTWMMLVALGVALLTNGEAGSGAQAAEKPATITTATTATQAVTPVTINFWLAFKGLKEFNFGVRPAFVILPEKNRDNPKKPWVWYAPTFYRISPNAANLWMMQRWLDQGYAIVGVDVGESFGNPEGRAIFNDFYRYVTKEFGLAPKAALLPQSRGGLMLYNWAAEHPECVRCIAGIYPVGDLRSYPTLPGACRPYGLTEPQLAAQLKEHNPVDRLAGLVKAGVPILHVHGDNDKPVPLEPNSLTLVKRYRELGGKAGLIIPHGHGHECTPAFFESQELVDFVLNPASLKSTTVTTYDPGSEPKPKK